MRDELNRTHQEQQTHGGPVVSPSSAAPAASQPAQHKVPARLDHPDHPDHSLYSKTRELVHQLDKLSGRMPDQCSDQLAAAVTVSARASGLQRVDKIALSDDASMLWAVQRPAGVREALFDQRCKVPTVESMNMPMEQTGAQWPQAMQQFHQHQEQAQRGQQQMQQQSQDQTVQQAGVARQMI